MLGNHDDDATGGKSSLEADSLAPDRVPCSPPRVPYGVCARNLSVLSEFFENAIIVIHSTAHHITQTLIVNMKVNGDALGSNQDLLIDASQHWKLWRYLGLLSRYQLLYRLGYVAGKPNIDRQLRQLYIFDHYLALCDHPQ